MELNLVKDLLEDVKAGVFTNLIYTVECPVKSEFKKEGYKVRKTVNITVRFKINYGNIKSVKEREYTPSDRKSNFVSVVKNAITYNTNTEKYYLSVFPFKRSHTKCLYEVYMPADDSWFIYPLDQIKESGLLIDSYFGKKSTDMYRINIENIFSIKGRWA